MNPHGWLNVANDLSGGPGPAYWRSGVSRAYYAAFHAARNLLRGCGFLVPQAAAAHDYLTRRLANTGHPDLNLAGSQLGRLRYLRNLADYDALWPCSDADAVDAILRADDIIRTLEAVPTVPAVQAAVTQAMRDYERDVLKEVTWRP